MARHATAAAVLIALGLGAAQAAAAPDSGLAAQGPDAAGQTAAGAPKTALTPADEAVLQAKIASRKWDGQPIAGLTLPQTQHYQLATKKIDDLVALIWRGDAAAAALYTDDFTAPSHSLLVSALGETGAGDYEAQLKIINEPSLAPQRAELAARPITGPATVYIPKRVKQTDAMSEAGVDPRGLWVYGRVDAEGGRSMTRISDTNIPAQSLNLTTLENNLLRAYALADQPIAGPAVRQASSAIIATMPPVLRAALLP
ncbi:MAG: hypothetical protein JWM33_4003 [Caulobacteraceae bacterium]|nr:hypothetical protein [Caulobacteraceae bacterium]